MIFLIDQVKSECLSLHFPLWWHFLTRSSAKNSFKRTHYIDTVFLSFENTFHTTFHLILIIPLWNRQKKYDSYFRGKGTEIRDPECFLLLTSPCSLTSLSVSPEVHTSSSAPSRLKPGSLDWSPSSLRLRPLPKTYVLSCSFKSQVFCNSLSGRKQKISVFLQAYILCLP